MIRLAIKIKIKNSSAAATEEKSITLWPRTIIQSSSSGNLLESFLSLKKMKTPVKRVRIKTRISKNMHLLYRSWT